jgi:hypothetical protein
MAEETKFTTEQAMRKALEAIKRIPAPHPLMISNIDSLHEKAKPFAKALGQAVKVAAETLQLIDVGGCEGDTGRMPWEADNPEHIRFRVGSKEGHVVMHFGATVSEMAILPDDAMLFGAMLIARAKAVDPEVEARLMSNSDEGVGNDGSQGQAQES